MIEVQIENTLTKNVHDLLSIPAMRPNQINIGNLTNYIQAIVLFDKVRLPSIPNRNYFSTDLVPSVIRNADIFETFIVDDYANRISRAKHFFLALSESTNEQQSNNVQIEKRTTGQIVLDHINKELKQQGTGWKEAFWHDVESVVNSEADWERESVKRVMADFDDENYGGLTTKDKLGIYYLWRCFYNVELAVDNQMVFLQNIARAPLSVSIYEILRKDLVRVPLLADCPLDLKSWILENMSSGKTPQSWKKTLPTLLHTVLKSAHGERERVAEAIIELRSSKKAESFRKHFREIRGLTSAAGMMQQQTNDYDHLLGLWSDLSELGKEPGAIIAPFIKRNFQEASDIIAMLLKIPVLAARYRHLKLFWYKVPNAKAMNRELAGLVEKTFGKFDS